MSESTEQTSAQREAGGYVGPAYVVINARFFPDGLVESITNRPDHLAPQVWFDRLCTAFPQAYQPLAGGRGAFRIPSDQLEVVRRESATA